MAVAALAISVVAGLAGSFMQMSAMNAQADAQTKIGEFNARQQEIEANKRQGEAAVRREQEIKSANTLAGKARAAFAQSGVDTTSGTPLLLDAEIIKQGTYRGDLAQYEGDAAARNLNEEAKGTRLEASVRAMSSRSQARASLFSGIGGAFSSIAGFKFG